MSEQPSSNNEKVFYNSAEDEAAINKLHELEKEKVPGLFLEVLVVPRVGAVSIEMKYFVGPFKDEGHRTSFTNYWQQEVGSGNFKNILKFISLDSIPGGHASLEPEKFGNLFKEGKVEEVQESKEDLMESLKDYERRIQDWNAMAKEVADDVIKEHGIEFSKYDVEQLGWAKTLIKMVEEGEIEFEGDFLKNLITGLELAENGKERVEEKLRRLENTKDN